LRAICEQFCVQFYETSGMAFQDKNQQKSFP
jgi:hypothetical protein